MKITIDVDVSALEARQFLGLPDVQTLQAAVLAKIETKMMAEAERFSPEGLLKTWFSVGPPNAERFLDMLGGVLPQARTGAKRGGDSRDPDQA